MTNKEETGKFETVFTRVVDRISRVAAYVAAGTVMPWTVLFMVYIIVRKSGLAAWEFVEEYTGYWMVFITCLALAYTLRIGGHIRIEVVSQHLPKRVQNILDILATLLALGAVGFFTQHALKHFVFAFTEKITNPGASQVILWPFYLWMPVGYALLGLALLLHLYHSVVVARKDWAKS